MCIGSFTADALRFRASRHHAADVNILLQDARQRAAPHGRTVPQLTHLHCVHKKEASRFFLQYFFAKFKATFIIFGRLGAVINRIKFSYHTCFVLLLYLVR